MELTRTFLSPFVAMLLLAATLPDSVQSPEIWDEDTPLNEVQVALGKEEPDHTVSQAGDLMWVKRGEDLIKQGRSVSPDGKISSYLSKQFLCTHCHNTRREDPNLANPDPEARLTYVNEQQLPFLPGATFYGIVNRRSWLGDDYANLYGEPGLAAQQDLRKAIRLCTVKHAKGRTPETWEVDAMLSYFWSLQLTLGDLSLSSEEYVFLRTSRGQEAHEKRLFLKEKYSPGSPAHFGRVPEDRSVGYGLVGDATTGRLIYQRGCMHCHVEGGVTTYIMDNGTLSFRHLRGKISRKGKSTFYEVIRNGEIDKKGARIHAYPLERMSDQQVEDLRAYIELMAS